MWERIKDFFDKGAGNFLTRNSILIFTFIILHLTMWWYFKEMFWNIFFAEVASTVVMAQVILWSNISVYAFTKLKITDDAKVILGQIFMGVCVVFSIVFGLIFWAKQGG